MAKISLIVPTNNLDRFKSFLDNVMQFTLPEEHKEIEVLTKFAREQPELLDYYDSNEWKKYPFNVKFIIVDEREGYLSLDIFDNKMILYSDYIESYFICIMSDRVRFKYKGWVSYVLQYKDKYKHGIFVLKTTGNKHSTYLCGQSVNHHHLKVDSKDIYLDKANMIFQPDNFPFYTKKFLCICSGLGDIHGPDSWFEPIIQILKYRYKCDISIPLDEDIFDGNTLGASNKVGDVQSTIAARQSKIQTEPYFKYNFEKSAKELANYIEEYASNNTDSPNK